MEILRHPSIEKPWQKYYTQSAIQAEIPKCTIFENILRHNESHLNDTVLIYYGRKITYREMFYETEKCAKALKQAGVLAGDRVTLCTSGVPESVYLVLACSKIGAIANFINPMFTTSQMIDRINETGSRLLFVLDVMHDFIANAISDTCIQEVIVISVSGSMPNSKRLVAKTLKRPGQLLKYAMRNAKYKQWNTWIGEGRGNTETTTEAYRENTPVVMVYSSGTTGASKGIQLTNDSINATVTQYEHGFPEVKRGCSFLHIIPIWFSSGVSISLLMPLCLGVSCILEPSYDFVSFTRDIKKYRPSYAFATTSFWLYTLNHIGKKHDLSHFHCPMTGGEPLLADAEKTINEFLKLHGFVGQLQKGWGLCELGATAVASSGSLSNAGSRNRIGSAGLPLPQITVGVFDMESNIELPYGQHGELRVITPCRMLGYYQNSTATDEFFREGIDGKLWACTGDIGYMDSDGFVYILGRANDSFYSSGGAKVYLFDIENVIIHDSAVDMCEAVDMSFGGSVVVVAHIVLHEEFRNDVKDAIQRIDRLCRDNLQLEAVPVLYKIRDGFAIKRFGKRDIESLKAERSGFINATGRQVQLPD